MDVLNQLIKQLPKAELHCHIEGTLEPELMLSLAARNNIKLPFNSAEELKQKYQFNNLQSFLDIYYQGANVLRQEQDFYDLTFAYLRRVNRDNVKHVEIFFDPQTHTERNVSFDTVISGIHRALCDGEKTFGISFRIILCFLRHLSEKEALETFEQAKDHKDKITAFGLDSSEVGHPPIKFAKVFNDILDHGFLTVAHAGEEGPPEYIWQALKLLKVKRIDHGVRSIEDPKLLNHLSSSKIPLTVCPLSNIKLKVFNKMEDHNIKQLLDHGICVTINSDDPAYFGGYIKDNYTACCKALDLDRQDLVTLAKNSFAASFLSQQQKDNYCKEIDMLNNSIYQGNQ